MGDRGAARLSRRLRFLGRWHCRDERRHHPGGWGGTHDGHNRSWARVGLGAVEVPYMVSAQDRSTTARIALTGAQRCWSSTP